MRLSIFVSIALIGVILLVEGTSVGNCVPFLKIRGKPRETRGYGPRPNYLATAIGFGKREVASKDKFGKLLLLLLHHNPQSIPPNWFLHEIRNNPELAKGSDEEENPDKLSTAELFKSERTISFF